MIKRVPQEAKTGFFGVFFASKRTSSFPGDQRKAIAILPARLANQLCQAKTLSWFLLV